MSWYRTLDLNDEDRDPDMPIPSEELTDGQRAVCKCPEFCDEGFVVATWDADEQKFTTSWHDGEDFHGFVTEYLPLYTPGKNPLDWFGNELE